MMRRRLRLLICGVLFSLYCPESGTSSISCPAKSSTLEPFRKVCFHPEVNVTVLRCLHDFGEEVYINYTVDRITETLIPITIEVNHFRNISRTTFRCKNGSISDLVKVVFAEKCKDPVVIVNKTATVNLSLDLEVKFSFMDMVCNTILIGPQRLNASCQVDPTTKQPTPFVQLRNVDTCSRVGPAIPIRLSTSLNSSIVLLPDGSNETVGSISVQPLPCSDNHTQAYIISVPFSGIYTITADIPHALLPKTCILVNECTCSAVCSPQVDPSSTMQIIVIVVCCAVLVPVFLLLAITCIAILVIGVCRKYMGAHGVHETGSDIGGSDDEATTVGKPQKDQSGSEEMEVSELKRVGQPSGERDTQRQEATAGAPVNASARPSADNADIIASRPGEQAEVPTDV